MRQADRRRVARRLGCGLLAAVLAAGVGAAARAETGAAPAHAGRLIVIGFVGGVVSPDDMAHRDALEARQLERRYPGLLYAAAFANRDGRAALDAVLRQLDADGDGRLSAAEKDAARIVIYGHSWGASEAVTLARRLGGMGIPVLLTIQIDSVEKPSEDDRTIPPNVRDAVNFYQTGGLLHGRRLIAAADPERTTILGNYRSSYRDHPIPCKGFSWFARAFMRQHIEIENDPSVWSRVEALIRARLLPGDQRLGAE